LQARLRSERVSLFSDQRMHDKRHQRHAKYSHANRKKKERHCRTVPTSGGHTSDKKPQDTKEAARGNFSGITSGYKGGGARNIKSSHCARERKKRTHNLKFHLQVFSQQTPCKMDASAAALRASATLPASSPVPALPAGYASALDEQGRALTCAYLVQPSDVRACACARACAHAS
jgi:hypothetical protein